MTIVVDASVAVKWVIIEEGSDAADALLDTETLVGPSLWLVEAANALWRLVRTGQIFAKQSNVRLRELLNAPVTALPVEPHIEAALRLAAELNHPIYDCLYLAVALHLDVDVVTADRRFVSAAAGSPHAARIRLLGSAKLVPLSQLQCAKPNSAWALWCRILSSSALGRPSRPI